MMRVVFAHGPEAFFGTSPYPFDLGMVEARDGYAEACEFVISHARASDVRILDAGCGWGRHAGPLAAAGFQVDGVDFSRTAVAEARKRHPRVRFHCADVRRLPFAAGTFDMALSLYSSIGYRRGTTLQTLRELHRVVRPGGTLILDVLGGTSRLRIATERVPGGIALVLRWRWASRVVQRNFVLSTDQLGLYGLAYDRFTSSTIAGTLRATGWDPVAQYGGYDRSSPGPAAPRLLSVGRCR